MWSELHRECQAFLSNMESVCSCWEYKSVFKFFTTMGGVFGNCELGPTNTVDLQF